MATAYPSAGRKGHRWYKAQNACLEAGELNATPCYGCGGRIDYGLRKINPRHPMAPTVHHIVELWIGGDPMDPANHTPCHFGCNVRLSNDLRRRLGWHPTRRVRPIWETRGLASRSW